MVSRTQIRKKLGDYFGELVNEYFEEFRKSPFSLENYEVKAREFIGKTYGSKIEKIDVTGVISERFRNFLTEGSDKHIKRQKRVWLFCDEKKQDFSDELKWLDNFPEYYKVHGRNAKLQQRTVVSKLEHLANAELIDEALIHKAFKSALPTKTDFESAFIIANSEEIDLEDAEWFRKNYSAETDDNIKPRAELVADSVLNSFFSENLFRRFADRIYC